MEPLSQPAIEVRKLSVAFFGRPVLHAIDLDAPAAAITVLVGASGSGKTTLLRAVNRLNECYAGSRTTGSVRLRLDGRWVNVNDAGYPLETLRRQAALTFQHPNPLPTSIAGNFTIPLRAVLGLSAPEIKERMLRALEEVQLLPEVHDRLTVGALTLSGGQQQRLCLARALALEPTFLLLDEPTASLDFRATEKIEELLHRLKTRYTILAVSHSLSQTRRLADRVVILQAGSVTKILERPDIDDTERFYGNVEQFL